MGVGISKCGGADGALLILMQERGVEPLHLSVQDPKSCASANSATPARAGCLSNGIRANLGRGSNRVSKLGSQTA